MQLTRPLAAHVLQYKYKVHTYLGRDLQNRNETAQTQSMIQSPARRQVCHWRLLFDCAVLGYRI
jgi:hypothetical protein